MGVLKRARGDPTQADEDVDYYTTSVSTDSSGVSTGNTINFDEAFDAAPTVLSVTVTDADGEAHQSALSASSIDVDVNGGPASSTVEVAVVVAGARQESA